MATAKRMPLVEIDSAKAAGLRKTLRDQFGGTRAAASFDEAGRVVVLVRTMSGFKGYPKGLRLPSPT